MFAIFCHIAQQKFIRNCKLVQAKVQKMLQKVFVLYKLTKKQSNKFCLGQFFS